MTSTSYPAPAGPRLLVLALAVGLGFTLSGSFGTVQESAKAELGLSDVQLALVQGMAAAVPMVLFSMPIGILVDRGNRMWLMRGFAILSILGSVGTALAGGFAGLFVARMMTGVAMTGGITAALSIASDLVLPARRGWAVFILNLGKSLGQAGGFALTGLVFGLVAAGSAFAGTAAPWRATHHALAVAGIVAALPLFLLREPARREVALGSRLPWRLVAHELASRRRFLLPLFVGQVGVVMADAAAIIWAAPVLTRSYGLTPQQFSGWMGAVLFGAGILGGVIGAAAAQAGQRSGRRGGLLGGAVVAAAFGIPAAFYPVAPSAPLFALAFGALMLAGAVTGLLTSVALTTLLPNEVRGLALGLFLALAGLVGFGAAPTLVSWVSLLLGGESRLATALAGVGVATSICALAGFWFAMRHAPDAATYLKGVDTPV